MTALGLLAAAGGAAVLLAGRTHLMLHLFQLEHYEAERLRLWVRRRRERLSGDVVVLFLAAGLALAASVAIESGLLTFAVGAGFAILSGTKGVRLIRRRQAKPLVFTARARRLFGLALALPVAALGLLALTGALGAPPWAIVACAAGLGLLSFAGTPELLVAADRILRPIQRLDNARFIRRAKRQLRTVDPLVIGVTGSFGKTTTKSCIAAVAELRGPSYPTPASFNSLLGVVRATNEGLAPHHRSYVVEMGAYRRGDVAEICDLVTPTMGVLTAIGPAHLERFGSLSEIEAAKGELAECLPASGTFITTADDERCVRASGRADCPVRLFSATGAQEADIIATDVRIEEGTTRFRVCRRTGPDALEEATFRTRLLGLHNVANLLAAATVGVEMGLPLQAISRALANVAPPPHRLAPIINRAAGVVVIDDAYNSNPVGAAAALEVLAAHRAERRLLVTPGMVELGEREADENRQFGAHAAEVCDIVVLVGKERAKPILEGLEDASFPASQIHVVADAGEAERLLAQTTRRGDVVLFENDLPDLYLEQNLNGGRTGT